MRPFEGVKILDCTHVLAGPFAAYQPCGPPAPSPDRRAAAASIVAPRGWLR